MALHRNAGAWFAAAPAPITPTLLPPHPPPLIGWVALSWHPLSHEMPPMPLIGREVLRWRLLSNERPPLLQPLHLSSLTTPLALV